MFDTDIEEKIFFKYLLLPYFLESVYKELF